MKPVVLFADDDASVRLVVSRYLTSRGLDIRTTDNSHTLIKWVKAGLGDIALCDVHMNGEEIFDFLPEIKNHQPDLPIIIISANTQMTTAIKSKEYEVFEYLPKPFDMEIMEKTIRRAILAKKTDGKKTVNIKKQAQILIGKSKAMQPVFRAISDYASANIPVYIWGEAGSGKSLVAKCLHSQGSRSSLQIKSFAKYDVNNLLLSELSGGDLLVDRLQDLSDKKQLQLLELLDINGIETEKFRVIAVANTSIEDLAKTNKIRSEILAHFMGNIIKIPNLSERRDDILDLAYHFLASVGKSKKFTFDKTAQKNLEAYHWPGNVREMENIMLALAIRLPNGDISADMINSHFSHTQTSSKDMSAEIGTQCRQILNQAKTGKNKSVLSPYEQALALVEKPLIEEALRICNGNNSKAAKLLGIHRNTLRTKIRQYW